MEGIKWTILVLCGLHFLLVSSADDKTGALTLVQTEEENSDDVTVEVNGEDTISTSHIEVPTEQFYPTEEWQHVKEGQAIPAGLHVRLNMETGEREAKLMEGDSDLKYWKAGDREGMVRKKKKQLSVDELKTALKDFKTTKLDETNLEREDLVKSKFQSYDNLKKEFEEMNMAVKTEGQIVEELVKKLKNKNIPKEELIMELQDLEDYLHQIDNAVVFKDYGGLEFLVGLLNNTKDEEIKMEAAMVIGAATSSNPHVQIGAVEAGALNVLLKMMSTESSVKVRKKVLYAISTISRNFPHAQTRFLQLGGLSVLSNIFKESDAEKLKIKSVSFLNDLLIERDLALQYTNKDKSSDVEKMRQYNIVHLRQSMLEQGWCELIPPLLGSSEHDSREQVLKTMKSLSETCTDKFVRSRTTLRHLQEEYKVLAVEEKEKEEYEYFTQMLTLVEDLVTLSNMKEEL